MSKSEEVRKFVEGLPIGKVFTKRDLFGKAIISSFAIETKKLIDLGVLERVELASYRKIKSYKAPTKKEARMKFEEFRLKHLAYRGNVYHSYKELGGAVGKNPASVQNAIYKDSGINGYLAFRAKTEEEAEYYAENFKDAKTNNLIIGNDAEVYND